MKRKKKHWWYTSIFPPRGRRDTGHPNKMWNWKSDILPNPWSGEEEEKEVSEFGMIILYRLYFL